MQHLLKTTEAAEMLGVTSNTLRNWKRWGVFMPYMTTACGHSRYLRFDVEQLLDQQRQAASGAAKEPE